MALRSRPILTFFLLGGLVFGVYSMSLSNPFHYDDLHSIRDNPHIRTLGNIPTFFTRPDYFTSDPRSAMYRPLVLVSYTLNYALDQLEVRSYHWVNIGIHSVNSGLVFLLAQVLLRRRAVALLAAVIFALHPVNSEVVNYISSRSESLCALFFLASLLAYIQARAVDRFRPFFYGLSLGAFAGALLCKSVAVTLVPLLVVFEVCFLLHSSSMRSISVRVAPFFVLALLYGLLIRQMLKTALIDAPVRPMWVQFATQTKALAYYVKIFFYPWELNIEHQFALGTIEPVVWLSALCVISLLVCAWHSGALIRFFTAWSLVVLLPTWVIPLNVLVNEHRLYMASVAFSIGLACCFEQIWQRRKARKMGAICCLALAIAFACIDVQRTLEWNSAESLWTASLNASPRMPRSHLYMGNVHSEAGRHQLALDAYTKALTVNPQVLSGGDLVSIHNNMGAAYLAMGNLRLAITSYEKTLSIDPEYEEALSSLEGARALVNEKSQERAKELQRRGLIALVQGRLEMAVSLLRESLGKRALPQTYIALAQAYERLHDTGAALRVYQTFLEANPVGPNAEQARLRMAKLRTVEDGGMP